MAIGLNDAVDHGFDLFLVGDIAHISFRGDADIRIGFLAHVDLFLVDVVEDDRRPHFGIRGSDSEADSITGTGNESYLAIQTKHFLVHKTFPFGLPHSSIRPLSSI